MPIPTPVLDDRRFDDLVSTGSKSKIGSADTDKLTFAGTADKGGAVGVHEITGALVKINLTGADGASDHIEIYELRFGTQVGSEGFVAHDEDHNDDLQSGDDFF